MIWGCCKNGATVERVEDLSPDGTIDKGKFRYINEGVLINGKNIFNGQA